MKKRVREDISAYLDGEAKDAQSISRLIAASEDAAKEHSAFAELSARLHSLDEPDIHPAFAARVVAAVEEQRDRRRAAWRLPLGLSTAALALAVAIVSIQSAQPRTSRAPAGAVAALAPAPAAPNEDLMLAELERRVSQDADLQHFFTARFDNAPQPADLYTERLIAAVAGSRSGAAAGEAFAHGMDYRAAVQRLDDTQADAFKQLLSASMQEALEG
jgi:anti-sigma factor RsiW